MSKLFDKNWWMAAGTRAIRTFFQAVLGGLGAALLIQEVNWPVVLSGAGLATLISLCTSLAGLPEMQCDTGAEEEG